MSYIDLQTVDILGCLDHRIVMQGVRKSKTYQIRSMLRHRTPQPQTRTPGSQVVFTAKIRSKLKAQRAVS